MQIINEITISEFGKGHSGQTWSTDKIRGKAKLSQLACLPSKMCSPPTRPHLRETAVPSAWAAIMKYRRLAILNNKNWFLTVLRLEVQDQGASQFDSWWELSSCPEDSQHLTVSSHVGKRAVVSLLLISSLALLDKGPNSITSFNLNHLLTVPIPT